MAGLARGRRAACLGWQAALNLALPAGERVVGRPQSGRPQSAPWRYRTASRAAAACDPPLRILQLCQPRFLHYLHGCSASLLSRQGLRRPGWRAGKGAGPGAFGSRVSHIRDPPLGILQLCSRVRISKLRRSRRRRGTRRPSQPRLTRGVAGAGRGGGARAGRVGLPRGGVVPRDIQRDGPAPPPGPHTNQGDVCWLTATRGRHRESPRIGDSAAFSLTCLQGQPAPVSPRPRPITRSTQRCESSDGEAS